MKPQPYSRPSSKLGRRSILTSIVAFGIVALVTAAATLLMQRSVDREVENRLIMQAETLVASILAGVEIVDLRLVAVEGLFRASEVVTADEYADFVDELERSAGLGGLAYMPIVDGGDLAAFEDGVAETIPGYEVFEIDKDGNRVAVAARDTYFPVQFFEPSDAIGRPLGLDAASPPGRLPFLVKAAASEHTVATPLLPLAMTEQEGFLLFRSISDAQGTIKALVAAPVVLSDLTADRVPDGLAKILDWTIRDVTEQTPGSTASGSLDPHVPLLSPIGEGLIHTDVFAVADRFWQVDVNATAGSQMLRERLRTHWILLAGLIAALLTGLAVYGYSSKRETITEMTFLKGVLEAKGRFLATVSHELRTPLTGVLGFAELLRDQGSELSADERAELVATIAEEAFDLSEIIDDILAMERAEQGTLTVLAVPVNVRGQTVRVLGALNLVDRIPVETAQPPVMAVADPGRVRQIIRNLISNAVAYGGPNVQITIEPVGEWLAFDVIDDGAGIPAEHVERIFDPYHRVHTNGSTTGSMGLGLSVSRTLAQHMGGDITYRRTGGKTHFQLTLPAETPRTTN